MIRAPALRRTLPSIGKTDKVKLLLVACTVVLAGVLLIPIVAMVVGSFRGATAFPFSNTPFTFSTLSQAWSSLWSGDVLVNTVIFSAASVCLAFVLALPLAYITERTNLRWRGMLTTLIFVAMCIPGFAYALSWLLLANPQSGILNYLLRLAFGLSAPGPLSIYNLGGMIFVAGVGLVPSMWLLLAGLVRNYDETYEDAGRIAGGSPRRVWRRITLPLLRPGTGAVLLLFFIIGLQAVEIPVALGPASRVALLPEVVFQNVSPSSGALPDYSLAAGYGVFTMIISLVLIAIYFRMLRTGASYVTVGERGSAHRESSLTRAGRWACGSFVTVYGLVGAFLPMAILVYASLLRVYASPGAGPLTLSWSNYSSILGSYSQFWHFFLNSVIVAAVAAVGAVALSLILTWARIRCPTRLASAAGVLSFLPLAISGTILSLALFVASLGTPLFQTLAIMAVAEGVMWIPYSMRLIQAGQLQIAAVLDEAVQVAGLSAWRAFRHVELPLLRGVLVDALLWIFVHAMKDFTVGLILASASGALVANIFYDAYQAGYFAQAAAMMTVLVVVNVAFVGVIRRRMRAVSAPVNQLLGALNEV